MSKNVVRTGVNADELCPPAPDDGWEWMKVNVCGEWRWLRLRKKPE